MRIRSLLASTLAVVLSVPAVARGDGLVLRLPALGSTSFTITDTTLVQFRGNNYDANLHNDDFFSLTERLDLAAQAGAWRLYTRVDGFVPWNHDTRCDEVTASLCNLTWDLRPERFTLRYQRGHLTLEGGDVYQLFGRGLALAVRKVDPVGLDDTIRGGRFEYEHGRFTMRGFGGVSNPQNLDPITLAIFPDPHDLLAGASTSVRLGVDDDVELSAHVVHVGFNRAGDLNHDVVDVVGYRLEAPSLLGGDLTLYAEVDALRRLVRYQDAPQQTRFGRAVYGAVQLVRGRWTLLVEWKDYAHYLLGPTENSNNLPVDTARIYSAAPTLEREDQRMTTNSNTRGGRVRVDLVLRPSPWSLTFNSVLYGYALATDPVGNLLDAWHPSRGLITTHSYVGFRRRSRPVAQAAPDAGSGASSPVAAPTGGGVTRVSSGDWVLFGSLGYRREFYREALHEGDIVMHEAGDLHHESFQGDLDVAFAVGRQDSLEVRLDHRFERNEAFLETIAGMRGGLAITWAHGVPLVVTASLRWDNTASGRDLLRQPFGATQPVVLPTLYPSCEVRWTFRSGSFLRVIGGTMPGGPICSGGICRVVPPFQGALTELVLRI